MEHPLLLVIIAFVIAMLGHTFVFPHSENIHLTPKRATILGLLLMSCGVAIGTEVYLSLTHGRRGDWVLYDIYFLGIFVAMPFLAYGLMVPSAKAAAFGGMLTIALCFVAYDRGERSAHAQSTPAQPPAAAAAPSYAQYFGPTCQAHRMTVVVASASWCGYCKRMDAETFADPGVRASMINDGFVKVMAEDRQDVIKEMKVDRYPTVVFLDHACREVYRFTGFRSSDRFLQELATARGKLPAQ